MYLGFCFARSCPHAYFIEKQIIRKIHFDVVVSPNIPVLASTSLPLTLLARTVAGILRLGKKPANTFANGFHSLRLEPGLLVSVLDPDPEPEPP